MLSINVMLEPTESSASMWEQGVGDWASNEVRWLTCCRVFDETHDVKTFAFRTADGSPVRFEPGQFLTVSADIDGQQVQRCYTIASPPTRPYLVAITVKRVPGGVMSNWLHERMRSGMRLRAHGPAGAFTSTRAGAGKLLYLSAGSGITPLMSMTRASVDLGLNRDIVFVHSARTPADIVFRDELRRLAALAPGLRLLFVCEGHGDEHGWTGEARRLTLPMLMRQVPDFATREAFTCGPAGYRHAVREALREGGHDPARYHEESFDLSTMATAAAESKTVEVKAAEHASTFNVRLSKSGKTFPVQSAETLLAAARRAGVAIASSCSQGVCGTCKIRVLEGDVAMKHNGGIREREVQKGFRLLCCSRAQSDLVLDL